MFSSVFIVRKFGHVSAFQPQGIVSFSLIYFSIRYLDTYLQDIYSKIPKQHILDIRIFLSLHVGPCYFWRLFQYPIFIAYYCLLFFFRKFYCNGEIIRGNNDLNLTHCWFSLSLKDICLWWCKIIVPFRITASDMVESRSSIIYWMRNV